MLAVRTQFVYWPALTLNPLLLVGENPSKTIMEIMSYV